MVVQPSIEAYEALLKRVKALEEEVKRLRNEKKDTGRSPAEVECNLKREIVKSRNSWADIYNETTALQTQNYWGRRSDRRWAGMARQVGSTREVGLFLK